MRAFLKTVAAIVAGCALGLAATWFAGVRGALPGGVSDGAWHTSLAIGSASGDLYTRASVAPAADFQPSSRRARAGSCCSAR